MLSKLHTADIAEALELLPPAARHALWVQVEEYEEAEVLGFLSDEVRDRIVSEMTEEEVLASAEKLEITDLADVVDELSPELTEAILEGLDGDRRERLEKVLSFEEGVAGRIMSLDVMSVREDVALGVVLRWLRLHSDMPSHTDSLTVIDDDGFFRGILPLRSLLTLDPGSLVGDVMQTGVVLNVNESAREVARIFERRDLISAPVVDEKNLLVGRITVDEVLDIIREDADRQLYAQAGLPDDEELFAPVLKSFRGRTIWLGLNLATVLLASWVIAQFQHAIETIVALAVLMPVVASMGGIAGCQTLTLTIRAIALDRLAYGNIGWLTQKEFSIGLLGGALWALVVGSISYYWFQQTGLSLVIAAAMVMNLVAGGLAGIAIPFFLHRVGIDPALSGAVILTTVTDIVGFLTFLGMATLFLI